MKTGISRSIAPFGSSRGLLQYHCRFQGSRCRCANRWASASLLTGNPKSQSPPTSPEPLQLILQIRPQPLQVGEEMLIVEFVIKLTKGVGTPHHFSGIG